MKNERGFTLVETLCALLVVSLAVLLIGRLSHAAKSLQREADMQFTVSREAANTLAEWRVHARTAEAGTHVRDMKLEGVDVRETESVEIAGELIRIEIEYAWQEGGRTREQTWALLQQR